MKSAFTDQDARFLIARPEFRRFCLHIYATSGIGTSASGADPYLLARREGCRSLGLETFRLAARGLPRGGTTEQALALILSEATPQETSDAATPQYESDSVT